MYSSSAFTHVLPQDQFHVFLSFRGPDTRDTFTKHLYEALSSKKIDTYIDNRIEAGDDIEYVLTAAIEKSNISIVVFSKNYASSRWCLGELAQIIKRKHLHGQVVLPVFYEVDPSDVRNQAGTYAEAFVKYKERFKNNMDKVSVWKDALKDAAALAGYHIEKYRPRSAYIDTIVKHVEKKLYFISSTKLRGILGIEAQVQKIELLSTHAPEAGICTIAIWGMSGMGKTTLANEVFLRLSPEFDSCLFLRNVSEELKKHGIPEMRKRVEEGLGIGSNSSKWHHKKKVLVVLDDVTNSSQIKDLLGDQTDMRWGSRIIITCKEINSTVKSSKHLLLHQMEGLKTDGALQLVHSKVSKTGLSQAEFSAISRRAGEIAGGIPIVLKLMSSALSGCKTRRESEDVLNRWSHKAKHSLIPSYDGLLDSEKAIFLDIACFFKGEKRGEVERMLRRPGFDAPKGIQSLINKSLISVSADDHIEMHDLVQNMGQSIVCQPSIENRSRLSQADDVNRVLRNNMGTERLEAICSDISTIPTLKLSPDTFNRMPCLRFLRLYGKPNVHLPGGLETLPAWLTYLHWARYPSISLPSDYSPDNLVELHLPKGKVKKLWNNKRAGNLKTLNLKKCEHLTEVPDFSQCPNIETLILSRCYRLVKLCVNKFHKLTTLKLVDCSSLEKFPEMPYSLQKLDLSFSDELTQDRAPDLSKCPNLEKLNLHNCANLVRLPNGFLRHLVKLTTLNMAHCSQLRASPEIPCSLRTLDLSNCSNLTEVPDLSKCPNLEEIDLSECTSLVQLPESVFRNLHKVSRLLLAKCSKLEVCPQLPRNIRYLNLSDCPRLTKVPDLSKSPNIEEIDLCGCTGLKQLPNSTFRNLNKISRLELANCTSLRACPELPCNIRQLDLSSCYKLTEVPNFLTCCPNIEEIDLGECTMLKWIPYEYVSNLDKLTSLLLERCSSLQTIPKLPKNLRVLHAPSCSKLTEFPDISRCSNIQRIDLSGCTRLVCEVDNYVTADLHFFKNPDIEIDLTGCTGLRGRTRPSLIRKAM